MPRLSVSPDAQRDEELSQAPCGAEEGKGKDRPGGETRGGAS
jgi:hypothetical protein